MLIIDVRYLRSSQRTQTPFSGLLQLILSDFHEGKWFSSALGSLLRLAFSKAGLPWAKIRLDPEFIFGIVDSHGESLQVAENGFGPWDAGYSILRGSGRSCAFNAPLILGYRKMFW
jgi:hypothetical protein